MSKNIKCKNCGSADIEVDNARGDAVCTQCGSVLEDNIIVSEVQFEEGAHGSSNAVGQFVSSESKGGATGYGKFQVGIGTESREVTLRKARNGITHLCHQLSLNQHCIETACNFFKMALSRHLTRGRRNTHIYAACVYITCRTEGTSHLLIDISDVLQICCYELGRTYLKLSQALCINIPSIDPCIYIMRFANKLELADKTHEVSMTAQRLVTRMKKDSIHSGRRPSGLCGAALLLAARMHDFSRDMHDIVKIVKIHESTLRKRLLEFGETPSSALTLDEFMTVDLEQEQDPPAFKAARKKDKERIMRLQDPDVELTSLQIEIEKALDKDGRRPIKRLTRSLGVSDVDVEIAEDTEVNKFIEEEVISSIFQDPEVQNLKNGDGNISTRLEEFKGKRPDLVALCLPNINDEKKITLKPNEPDDGELDLSGINDDELDGYIMTPAEASYKDQMWNKLNAEYLKMAKDREERLAKEREEGKPEKKKRRTGKRKTIGPSNTAGEAIEKMLQEKKISNKINYDILKTLTQDTRTEDIIPESESIQKQESSIDILRTRFKTEAPLSRRSKPSINIINSKRIKFPPATSSSTIVSNTKETITSQVSEEITPKQQDKKGKINNTNKIPDEIVEDDEEIEEDEEPAAETEEHDSLRNMLRNDADDDYYGYEDDY